MNRRVCLQPGNGWWPCQDHQPALAFMTPIPTVLARRRRGAEHHAVIRAGAVGVQATGGARAVNRGGCVTDVMQALAFAANTPEVLGRERPRIDPRHLGWIMTRVLLDVPDGQPICRHIGVIAGVARTHLRAVFEHEKFGCALGGVIEDNGRVGCARLRGGNQLDPARPSRNECGVHTRPTSSGATHPGNTCWYPSGTSEKQRSVASSSDLGTPRYYDRIHPATSLRFLHT